MIIKEYIKLTIKKKIKKQKKTSYNIVENKNKKELVIIVKEKVNGIVTRESEVVNTARLARIFTILVL